MQPALSASAGVVLVLVCRCLASAGDTSWDFNVCARGCVATNCTRYWSSSVAATCASAIHGCVFLFRSATLPLALSLLRWSCEENCEYECMHRVTAQDVAHGRPVRQFHGKV